MSEVTRMKPMSYIRTIKPDFFFDPHVGELSHTDRLLMIGLLCWADDQGRFMWLPGFYAEAIFGFEDEVGEREVISGLRKMESLGLIQIYSFEGMDFGVFSNWHKHQFISKPKKSSYPPPPTTYGIPQLELVDLGSDLSPAFSPTEAETETETETETSIVDNCWQVWREQFDGGRGRPYTINPKRKQKLRSLYREQLKHYDDPIAVFRRVCQYLAQHDFFGKKENKDKVLPESVFRDEGRREKHVKAALNWEPDAGTAEWVGSEAERIRNLGGGDG